MLSPSVDRSALTRKAALCTTVCAMILVGALAAVGGQATAMSGKFFGTVYDPSGGVIPNATVIVANPVAKTKDMTTTSAAGVFEFPGLPVGEYTLEVLASGFMRHLQSGVVLEPGQSRSERITLKVGMVSERIEVVGEGTPANPQADTSKPRERIRVGGNVQATKLVKMERPSYPLIAKSAGVQGTVLLEGVIGQDGSVQNLHVLNSQIDPDLAKAAVEAVSKWVYQPTLLNGKPVEIITQITINFTLAK